MKVTYSLLFFFISTAVLGQSIDTLTFYSTALNEERNVYIHKPTSYKYKADSIQFPVIFILDGQNEWFVNPLISNLKYLRFTKEIPSALIVVVPLKNRVHECAIQDLNESLPLATFLTQELDKKLIAYQLHETKILIGHSFSASFSLHTFYKHSTYYSAIIANSPYDQLEPLISGFLNSKNKELSRISIAIGSVKKDEFHRKKYNQLKLKYPDFFDAINTFEADYSAHNAVPITAAPTLLSKAFNTFKNRYSNIAQVDLDYKLIEHPKTISETLKQIEKASSFEGVYYAPEISDINGIASRFWNNNFEDYAIEIYNLGLSYYPTYYDFYLSLYELWLPKNALKAKEYIGKAETLLLKHEENNKVSQDILAEIKREKEIHGWE